MKSFVISLCALLALFILVGLNSFYVQKTCSSLDDATKKVENLSSLKEIEFLEEKWHKNKFFISLSVPHKQTDEVEKNILILKEKIIHSKDDDFHETKRLLLNAIKEMSNHGALNADNIL